MTFTPNIHIDAVKASYKLKYDEILNKIHNCKDLDEKRKLQKKESRLNNRTKRFIARHNEYFRSKRKWHFENMEKFGVIGEAPDHWVREEQ